MLGRLGFALAAIAFVGVAGCGEPARQTVPADKVAQIQLEDVYGLYKTHVEKLKRPPSKLEQLYAWEPAYVNGYAAVNEGKVVVVWGVPVPPAPGTAPTILAYEKDVPSDGGFVLFQDGAVRHLTSAEFQLAPQAGRR